jgi:hypothetical protein
LCINRYLCIGTEGGSRGRCVMLGITACAFIEKAAVCSKCIAVCCCCAGCVAVLAVLAVWLCGCAGCVAVWLCWLCGCAGCVAVRPGCRHSRKCSFNLFLTNCVFNTFPFNFRRGLIMMIMVMMMSMVFVIIVTAICLKKCKAALAWS